MEVFEIGFMGFCTVFAAVLGWIAGWAIMSSTYEGGPRNVKRACIFYCVVALAGLSLLAVSYFSGPGEYASSSEIYGRNVLHLSATAAFVCFLWASLITAFDARQCVIQWLDAAQCITQNVDVLFSICDVDKDGVISERDLDNTSGATLTARSIPSLVHRYMKNNISAVGHVMGSGGRTVYAISRADVQACQGKHQDLYKLWL